MQLAVTADEEEFLSETGYKNEAIELTGAQLLENIRAVQTDILNLAETGSQLSMCARSM